MTADITLLFLLLFCPVPLLSAIFSVASLTSLTIPAGCASLSQFLPALSLGRPGGAGEGQENPPEGQEVQGQTAAQQLHHWGQNVTFTVITKSSSFWYCWGEVLDSLVLIFLLFLWSRCQRINSYTFLPVDNLLYFPLLDDVIKRHQNVTACDIVFKKTGFKVRPAGRPKTN